MSNPFDPNSGSEFNLQTGSEGAAAVSELGERKRRRRMLFLFLLSTLVISAVLLDIYYLVTKKPITELVPPAVAIAKTLPPTFVATFYGVSAPMGIAVSPDSQRIYVSESEGDRHVRAFDRTGRELFSVSSPMADVLNRQPVYISTDDAGQIYVADRLRKSIGVYSPEGQFTSDLAIPEEAAVSSPLGVATDRAGKLLITDTTGQDHKIVVLDRDRKMVRRIGKMGDGPGDLLFPNQATADSRGRIYVTNGNLARIDMFNPDGSYVGPLSGAAKSIGLPRGIAIDHLDRLFAVDAINCAVHVFDVSGEKPSYLYSFGEEGDGNGQLRYPGGIAVDSTGRVYVADRVNYRVQVWNY